MKCSRTRASRMMGGPLAADLYPLRLQVQSMGAPPSAIEIHPSCRSSCRAKRGPDRRPLSCEATPAKVIAMTSTRNPPVARPQEPSALSEPIVDLTVRSDATGVPVDALRIFSAISDPANKDTFSTEAARKVFGGVRV